MSDALAASHVEVAVLGGGLAGAMAAAHLAGAGIPVVVFEQATVPQPRVCGEFLSYEGAALLRDIGVELPDGPSITTVGIHGPTRGTDVRLPDGCRGISRLVLDEAVRRRAEALGAVIMRGVTVQRCERRGGIDAAAAAECGALSTGARLQTTAGCWEADAVIVATGKRDLRGVPSRQSTRDVVGVQLHVPVSGAVRARWTGRVDLWVGEGAYGGAALVDEGLLNVSCVLPPATVQQHGVDASVLMPALLRAHPAAQRVLSELPWPDTRVTTVAPVPYGYVRAEAPWPGMFCGGDQLAVIPSLTGDGMTLALATGRDAGRVLAQALLRGRSEGRDPHAGRMALRLASSAYHTRAVSLVRRQIRVATWAQALFARPQQLNVLLRGGRLLTPVVRAVLYATRVPAALRMRDESDRSNERVRT
jgi:flavin-dependent dehydrogenase